MSSAQSLMEEMLSEARSLFAEGKTKSAEPLLQQLLLKNFKRAELHQMLGTIAYEQGQFKKAIQSFQRALEIDPANTDASIGLSIILNDLGRYEEGRKVFQDAQARLDKKKNAVSDTWLEEKIVAKHEELADLYMQARAFDDAIEQLVKAQKRGLRKAELSMRIADAQMQANRPQKAVQDLRPLILENPRSNALRLKLAQALYQANNVAEAVEQWETVLSREPGNAEATRSLKMAQAAGVTSLGL